MFYEKDSSSLDTSRGEKNERETERNMATYNRERTKIMGMTWGEAERKAHDRQQWRALAVASCASTHEED